MVKVYSITSARPGFRRAGIAHPIGPTNYPLDFFTKEQLRLIEDEPMLTIEKIDADEMAPIIQGKATGPISALASGLLQIPLGGEKSIKLAELVAIALHQSKLTVADWNLLSDAERAEHLQPVLNDAVTDQQRAITRASGPGEPATTTDDETPPPSESDKEKGKTPPPPGPDKEKGKAPPATGKATGKK
ncbi:MAG: hypothetical protein GC184_14655 [Rhizobiales bacterium]|nr:hypothetical protein [Hyphomicrobiales bacterium]